MVVHHAWEMGPGAKRHHPNIPGNFVIIFTDLRDKHI
jgi:hypothetical protein